MNLGRYLNRHIFHAKFYSERHNVSLKSSWNHFNSVGIQLLLNPSPLIDPLYIFAHSPTKSIDLVSLKLLLNTRINPHPLFNLEYFESQISKYFKNTFDAIDYYYKLTPVISSSPLFSVDEYYELNPDVKKAGVNPLIHYIEYGANENRNHTTSFQLELSDIFNSVVWPELKFQSLTHLEKLQYSEDVDALSFGSKHYTSSETSHSETDSLFDIDFYRTTYPDIARVNDPYWHFKEHGVYEGRKPNVLFDPVYISSINNVGLNSNLLEFYKINWRKVNPHPLFDSWLVYKEFRSDIDKLGISPLEYFLQFLNLDTFIPSNLFDVKHYLSQSAITDKSNPLIHYLKHGHNKEYSPSQTFNPNIYQKIRTSNESKSTLASISKYSLYLQKRNLKVNNSLYHFEREINQLDYNKPSLIFISHDGSWTGAPLIIYNLSKYYSEHFDVNTINLILRKGGALVKEFSQTGPTYIISDFNNTALLEDELDHLIDRIKSKEIIALVNSAESRVTLPILNDKNVFVLSLIHEMAHFYPESAWSSINDHSDLVLFPSHIVKKYALKNTHFDHTKIHVRGQGIFPDKLSIDNKNDYKSQLRDELNLEEDSFIVLGCGTINSRKGVDLFIYTAISYIKSHESNVTFIWLGGAPTQGVKFYSDLKSTISHVGLNSKILLLPSTPQTSLYFGGSDMFFMASRADPFPCVVLEAIEFKLPVLYFENTGGYEEILDDPKFRLSTELGNITQSVELIEQIRINQRHKEDIVKYQSDILRNKYTYDKYVEYINQIIGSKLPIGSEFTEHLGIEQMRKINIIFTIDDYWISGVNTVIINTIRGLLQLGENPILLITKIISPQHLEDIPLDIPVKLLDLASNEPAEIKAKFLEFINSFDKCTLIPHTDYLITSFSKELSLIPTVTTIGVLHADDVEHYDHGYTQGRYWDHIVCVSTKIKDKLLEINQSFSNKTSVILNGVVAYDQKELLNKFRNVDILRICYVGRLVQFQKRVLDFEIVVAKLKETNLRFHLTIIGDGPEYQKLNNLLRNHINSGYVTLAGKLSQEETMEKLEETHLVTLISDFEGLPMSILEGMARNCIPLVSRVESGLNEILNEDNSLIFEIGDYNDMVDKIVEFIALSTKDKIIMSEMSCNTLSEKGLTSEIMAKNYLALSNHYFHIQH